MTKNSCVCSPLKECGSYWELCVPVWSCISVRLCHAEASQLKYPPITSRTPQLLLGWFGECLSSPSGSEQSPAAKRILVHFRHKRLLEEFRNQ